MLKKIFFFGLGILCFNLSSCYQDAPCPQYYQHATEHVIQGDSLWWEFSDFLITAVAVANPPTPDCITETITNYPYHGQLIQVTDTLYYVPDSGYAGVDSFEYRDRFCNMVTQRVMVWESQAAKCAHEFALFEPCARGYGLVPDKDVLYRIAPPDCRDCIDSVVYTYIPSEGQPTDYSFNLFAEFILTAQDRLRDSISWKTCINCGPQQTCRDFTLQFHIK